MLSSQRQERTTVWDFPESRFSSQLVFIEHLNPSEPLFVLPFTSHLDCVALSCPEAEKEKGHVTTTGLGFLPKWEEMEWMALPVQNVGLRNAAVWSPLSALFLSGFKISLASYPHHVNTEKPV